MSAHTSKLVSVIVMLAQVLTLIPPKPVLASVAIDDSSMEDALLLMFAANARLIADTSVFPEESFTYGGFLAKPVHLTSGTRINEQRLLARYYLELAEQLPPESKQAKTFLAKAVAHNEMAGILQRRRDRENNPFQKLGRTVTRPFKFIAGEIMKLTGKAIKLLEEVGPEIILEMVKSYITSGTPINVRIFFHKYKDIAINRVRQSITNKATAILIGLPPPAPPVKPRITVTTSRLMQTMTVRAKETSTGFKTRTPPSPTVEITRGPKKYGLQVISPGLNDLSDAMIVSKDYFIPLIKARTECGYVDFQAWDFDKFSMPMQIDLDKGTFSVKITGTGNDYLEPNETTVPAWDFTATFSGEISDGTITPKEDLTGWVLEGTMKMTVVPAGKMQCLFYPPDFPEADAVRVWLNTNRSFIVEHNFFGEINQQKILKDGKKAITPGGEFSFDIGMAEANEDSGDYFYIQVENMAIPPGFPVP